MNTSTPLKRMQKALVLQDVCVLQTEARLHGDFDPKYTKESLGVQIKFVPKADINHIELTNEANAQEKINILRYSIETGVRFVSLNEKSEEPPVRASVTAVFAADYVIKSQDLVDDEGIAAFAQNVAYHIWPYWREFIHSMSNRLRLPAAVLPMYRPNWNQAEDHSADQEETKKDPRISSIE